MDCWFWNIDKPSQEFFTKELDDGRLRQGWGYDENLDLRTLRRKKDRGDDLTQRERRAWDRCHQMLDTVSEGDYVAVKNVPSSDEFTLVEVTGPYEFDLKDIGDFGHYLPVQVIRSFHKKAAVVPAPMVNALERDQYPLRRTLQHRESVISLAEQDYSGPAASKPEPGSETVESWRSALRPALKAALKDSLNDRLAEELILAMLEKDGLDVVHSAGPSEKGADILAEIDVGYGLSTDLAVQVKMHWGTDRNTRSVEQLAEAFEEHDVDMGLLVTFADELGEELESTLDEAKKKYQIQALWGEELYFRLVETLTDSDYELELMSR